MEWKTLAESRSFESNLIESLEEVVDIEEPWAALRLSLLLLQEENILGNTWSADYLSAVVLTMKLRVILQAEKESKISQLPQIQEFARELAVTLDRVQSRKWADAIMKIEVPVEIARQFMNGGPRDEVLVRLQTTRYWLPLKTMRCLMPARCALWKLVNDNGYDVVFPNQEKIPQAASTAIKRDLSLKDRYDLWDSLRLDYLKKLKEYPKLPSSL